MKTWKIINKKLRGAYGETDYKKMTIAIDKKRHTSKNVERITPNNDGTENMAITLRHEILHAQHPKWGEVRVEKAARMWYDKATKKQKNKIYSKMP